MSMIIQSNKTALLYFLQGNILEQYFQDITKKPPDILDYHKDIVLKNAI